jgi:hypothetical protein
MRQTSLRTTSRRTADGSDPRRLADFHRPEPLRSEWETEDRKATTVRQISVAHPSFCTRGDGAHDESARWLRVHAIDKQMLKKLTRPLGAPCKVHFTGQPFSAKRSRDESSGSLQLQAAHSIFPPVPISRRVRSDTCTQQPMPNSLS